MRSDMVKLGMAGNNSMLLWLTRPGLIMTNPLVRLLGTSEFAIALRLVKSGDSRGRSMPSRGESMMLSMSMKLSSLKNMGSGEGATIIW